MYLVDLPSLVSELCRMNLLCRSTSFACAAWLDFEPIAWICSTGSLASQISTASPWFSLLIGTVVPILYLSVRHG
jgi:hypothetical protein